jgi:hypothetical protein
MEDYLTAFELFTNLQIEGYIKGNLVQSLIEKGYTEIEAINIATYLIDKIKKG